MPYSFHLVPRSADAADTSIAARVQINNSILADALTPPKVSTSKTPTFSPEDVFELWCEPQAVFRVRSVGRCSATLSGGSPGSPDRLLARGARTLRWCRPRITDSVLCPFTYRPIRRYWLWRCHVPYMGYGDRDAQGQLHHIPEVPKDGS